MASARPAGTPRVTWSDLERDTGKVTLTPTQELGYRLFLTILALIGILFIGLAAYAGLTWPRVGEVSAIVADLPEAEQAQALSQLRTDWHREVRETAQTVALGPLVPLLSAIIGYVLGRERSTP